MANFFVPSYGAAISAEHYQMAADRDGLDELPLPASGNATFGLWGGDFAGNALKVRVTRNGATVSEGAGAAVKLVVASKSDANHVQIYNAAGLKDGDVIQAFTDAGAPFTGKLPVRALGKGSNDVMAQWAIDYKDGNPAADARACCRLAIPYLALKDYNPKRGAAMPKLEAKCIGPGLANVHGLSVHSTSGVTPQAFDMAANLCVQTWNGGSGASAHFGIALDGTIIQFISTRYQAYGQGNPGDYHWVSVEICNGGTEEMNGAQLTSAQKLFRWVATTFGITPALATGCLYAENTAFDALTKKISTTTSSDNYDAATSQGLSCHWWLDPRKVGPHVHACPGPGIISQLPQIVAG